VAKDLSSHYIEKRSRLWLKVKVHQEDEFVVAGFTAPEGLRRYFVALLLGAYAKGKLRYVGKVGTGFDEDALAALYKTFKPLVRRKPALAEPPQGRNVTYLEPRLVAQVSYQEWTADQELRQPVFLGLRHDKRVQDVRLPEANK
jgi:bifunctional non-homologous end joining protein LigD